MAEEISYDDLLVNQRKEKKELFAKTVNMKHSVPKGDKKKKKELILKITEMLAELDLKHENELKAHKDSHLGDGGSSENISDDSKETVAEEQINTNFSELSITNTQKLSADEIDNRPEPVPKLSKAQKRRNKKADLHRQRNKEIAEQEIANLSGMRNLEAEEIRKKLSERNLSIHEIPSDGNCLYRAIEHQLSFLNLKQISLENLRVLTSQYLLSHKEDFIPFLTSSVTGDLLSDDEYTKYCKDVAKTSAWGGHIEIQVLSNICGYPIEVIQADGPSLIIGDENKNPKLIISFHKHMYGLGAHYNSVVTAVGRSKAVTAENP